MTGKNGSRLRLLEAGSRLIADGDRRILESGFTAKSVASAAGLSRRTFYDQFETVGMYVDALLDFVWEHRRVSPGEIDVEADLAQFGGNALPAFRASVESALENMIASGSWKAYRLLEAFVPDGEDPPSAPVVDALIDLMHVFGRRSRPPLDGVALGDTLTAALETTAACSHGAGPVERSDVFLLLLEALTTDTSDERDLEGMLDAAFEPMSQRWYELRHPVPISNLRAHILDAAESTFRKKGFQGTEMADIGRVVGLAPSTIERYVGSKTELADQLVTRVLPGLGAAIDRDLEASPDSAFFAHLERLEKLFREDRIILEIVMDGLPEAGNRESVGPPEGVAGLFGLGTRASLSLQVPAAQAPAFCRLASVAVAASVAFDPENGGPKMRSMIAPA